MYLRFNIDMSDLNAVKSWTAYNNEVHKIIIDYSKEARNFFYQHGPLLATVIKDDFVRRGEVGKIDIEMIEDVAIKWCSTFFRKGGTRANRAIYLLIEYAITLVAMKIYSVVEADEDTEKIEETQPENLVTYWSAKNGFEIKAR